MLSFVTILAKTNEYLNFIDTKSWVTWMESSCES